MAIVLAIEFISFSGDRLGSHDRGNADFLVNGNTIADKRSIACTALLGSATGR